MEISLQGVYDSGDEWPNRDFVNHYRNGDGQAVALRETGHLEKIVRAYMDEVEERLKDQVASAARASLRQSFIYDFF